MHAAISGTIDFRETGRAERASNGCAGWSTLLPDDPRRRRLDVDRPARRRDRRQSFTGSRGRNTTSATCSPCILDDGPFDEYKAEYGQTLVCGYGRLGGVPVGVVANQRKRCKPAERAAAVRRRHLRRYRRQGRPLHHGLQPDAACRSSSCRTSTASWSAATRSRPGIIRAGAKLVNVIANSVVPKITRDPRRLVRRGQLRPVRQGVRPALHLRLADGAVRRHGRRPGGQHAARHHRCSALKRGGHEPDAGELDELRDKVKASYDEQTDVRYAAARLWVDRIVEPENTRSDLLTALEIATRFDAGREFKTGVLQV